MKLKSLVAPALLALGAAGSQAQSFSKGLSDTGPFTVGASSIFEPSTFTRTGLAAGTHASAVTGTVTPGSAYTGKVVIASVPEPGTYAMLLSGLGVMGFVAARRARSS